VIVRLESLRVGGQGPDFVLVYMQKHLINCKHHQVQTDHDE
jgi:hypothetical protein